MKTCCFVLITYSDIILEILCCNYCNGERITCINIHCRDVSMFKAERDRLVSLATNQRSEADTSRLVGICRGGESVTQR